MRIITVRSREFPGEGELPVLELLEAAAGGYLTHLGLEVFAERADAMDPIEAGRHSGETARAIMAIGGLALTP